MEPKRAVGSQTLSLELKKAKDVKLVVPGIRGMEPRSYQRIGAAFLHATPRSLLLDEVGLGKTLQLLMTAALLKSQGMKGIFVVPG